MIWIVDDFYPDPYKIREEALKLDYHRGRGTNPPKMFHPGHRAIPNWWSNRLYLRNRFAEITGKTPTSIGMKAMGAFNIGYAEKQNRFNWVHADEPWEHDEIGKMYAAVIYLTPNPPANTGTLLFEADGKLNEMRSLKELKAHKNPHFYGSFWDTSKDFQNKYKVHCKVENRFNRLIMYDASYLHTSEDAGFGDTKETARLTQIGFWYGED